ncbi:MAG TPA: OsmC family protein [Novosphingobium sp.]|nr:OsmC family protein [Novosphingobium sp.]HZV10794.1 OsmC family protein [Novosphingobium sp.]
MAHIATASAASTGAATFQSRTDIAGTAITTDEPVELGGLGSGPNPYDLLCAALATCTTMTLRFYAARQGWEIGEVATHVTHRREAGASPADVFNRTITLAASLPADQRTRLLDVAERCPVHKTLSAGAAIHTRGDNA